MFDGRPLLLPAIRLYQRWLSPLKGFRCAYCAYTGRATCSNLGLRAIRRFGTWRGLAVLRRRLYLCGVAHRRYACVPKRVFRQYRGDCDLACDLPIDASCDWTGKDGCDITDACRFADCGSCDLPSRKRDRKRAELHVRLPKRVRPER